MGALPIFDLQGKVSLQFLLASYKALEKSRSKLRGESELDLHRPFLRFLMCKAIFTSSNVYRITFKL